MYDPNRELLNSHPLFDSFFYPFFFLLCCLSSHVLSRLVHEMRAQGERARVEGTSVFSSPSIFFSKIHYAQVRVRVLALRSEGKERRGHS